ncbi:MAG: extracellular solute-binding protein [Deltaproteobacteria bacterium]|nr:extracellular solute-binding protein [Deltaproteobacteria bacterium]
MNCCNTQRRQISMMLQRSLAAISLFTFLLHGTSFAATVGSTSDEWEKTVKAAEQEGQVTVYKLGTDAEFHAFQKRYPKIKLNLVAGSGSQILQRIMAERRAGKYLADVVRTGGGTAMTMLNAKAFDPIPPALILPEVKDASKWFDGKHHYNDGENRYIFVYAAFPLRMLAYNSKLVDPKSLTSYMELLDPKWKGKVSAKDPNDPGGASPLLSLYYNSALGPEYLKKLITAGGLVLVRDERQQTDWIASGKVPIAITAKATEVDEAKRQGLPVDVMDPHHMSKEGVAMEAGGTMLALLNRAPHPNAAKVMLNWFLSREGQIAVQKGEANDPGPNSLREDIPKDEFPAWALRQKNVKYQRLWGPDVWDRDVVKKLVNELK